MKNLPVEYRYNLLVQIDYLAGLCAAYMLGAEQWFLFFVLLVVSLCLGWVTIREWAKIMRTMVQK